MPRRALVGRVVLVVLVGVVAACGRGHFDNDALADGTPDTPTGHDEDGDGLPDAFDNCPAHANAEQTDQDGDHVGDACDPEPANPRQTIALFSSFAAADPTYVLDPGWSFVPDALHCDGTSAGGVSRNIPIGNADVWAGIAIVTPAGTQPRSVEIVIGTSLDPHYKGSLYEDSMPRASIVEKSGSNFNNLANQYLIGVIHTGHLTMHLTTQVSPPHFTFDAAWPGEPYHVEAAVSTFGGGPNVFVDCTSLIYDLEYVFVVTTAG